MKSLLDEMKRCKTIDQCIEVATMDAYGEEQAGAWEACIEEMFGKFDKVKVFGDEVKLEGFEQYHSAVVAKCKKGKFVARVTLESIDFSKLSAVEKLWLKAWTKYSNGF